MSLSLNQTLLTFWFYVKQIGWLIWFWQFLCDRLSSFNPKGFYYSYTWSCSLCEGRTSFCRELFTGKLYRFLQIQLTLLCSVSYFFLFLSWSPSLSLCLVFGSISSNMDEVLSINPGLSMNIFCAGNKLLLQRVFFKNSTGHLLLALRFLGGLYNFHHFLIIFSLLLVMMMCSRRAKYFTDSKMI